MRMILLYVLLTMICMLLNCINEECKTKNMNLNAKKPKVAEDSIAILKWMGKFWNE